MRDNSSHTPFVVLGKQLQRIREDLKESVAEVSGAIEIDEKKLNRIEQGHERPSEDILLLLISHFSIHDDEAVKLWDLAGYDRPVTGSTDTHESMSARQLVMIMTSDSRIIYSDNVQVLANANGVVMNFLQAPGNTYSQQTIARIGMSREQAGNVLKILGEALDQSSMVNTPKSLPAPGVKSKKDTENK